MKKLFFVTALLLLLLALPLCLAQIKGVEEIVDDKTVEVVNKTPVVIDVNTLKTYDNVTLTKQDWAERTLYDIKSASVEMTRDSVQGEDCFIIDSDDVCFKTSEYAHLYYAVQSDNKSVKFGWKVDTPVGNKDFSIVANKPISELTNVDWTDFDRAGLDYSVDGNMLTIHNPELTNWWFDPVINTSYFNYATMNPNQRKTIVMPNGNIYTVYGGSSGISTLFIELAKSSDYGTTWTKYNLTANSGSVVNYLPSMILGTDNTIIHIVWELDGTNKINYAQWNTTSDTLIGTLANVSGTTSATTEAFNPDIATLNNGTIGIAYQKEDGIVQPSIRFKQCLGTCLTYASWGSEIAIMNGSASSQHVNPDIETNGTKWHMVFASDNNTYYQIKYTSSNDGITWTTPEAVNYNLSYRYYVPSLIIKDNYPMLVADERVNHYGIVFAKRNDTAWSSWKVIYNLTGTTQKNPQLSTDGSNLYAVWAGTNGLNTYSEENFTTGTTYELNNTATQYHGWYAVTSSSVTKEIANNEINITDGSATQLGYARKSVQQTTPNRIDFRGKTNLMSATNKVSVFFIGDFGNGIAQVCFYSNTLRVANLTNDCPTGGGLNAGTMELNTYYNISIRNINWTSKTFDFYVNNTLKFTNLSFYNNLQTYMKGYEMCLTSAAGTGYSCTFDELQVWDSNVSSTSYHSVMFSNSSDDGATWSSPTELGSDWALTVNADLYPNLPYQYGKNQDLSVLYTKSWDANNRAMSNDVVFENLGIKNVNNYNTTILNKTSYTTPVKENSSQTFTLELNWTDGVRDIQAVNMTWNGTIVAVTSSSNKSSNESNYTITYTIPWINGAQQNVTIIWNYTINYTNGSNLDSNFTFNQTVNRLNDTLWTRVNYTSPVKENSSQTFTLELNWTDAIKNVSSVNMTWNGTTIQPTSSVNATNQSNYTIIYTIPWINGLRQNATVSWNYTVNFWNGTNNYTNSSFNQSVNRLNDSLTSNTTFASPVKEGSNTTFILKLNWTDAIKNVSNVKFYWNNTEYKISSYDNLTSNTMCYQEHPSTVNQSGIDGRCPLNYTGLVATNGTYTDVANVTDGNFSTAAIPTGTTAHDWAYMNYSKPFGALSTSLWQVNDTGGIHNLSIPATCWAQNTLQFAAYGLLAWQCWDGAAWTVIETSAGQNPMEEAVWWNISTNSSYYNVTITTPWINGATQIVDTVWNWTNNFYNGTNNISRTHDHQTVIRLNDTEWMKETHASPVTENSLQTFTLELNWTDAIKNVSSVEFRWNDTEYAVNSSVNSTNQSNYSIAFYIPFIVGVQQNATVNWNWTNNFWNGTNNMSNTSFNQTVNQLNAQINTSTQLVTPVKENSSQTFNFSINWSAAVTSITGVNFNWNGTPQTGTMSSTNGTFQSNYTITMLIPWINGATQTVPTVWNYTINYVNTSIEHVNNSADNQLVRRLNDTQWTRDNLTSPVVENTLQNFTLEVNWTDSIKNLTNVKFYWNDTEYTVNSSVNATNQSNYSVEFYVPFITGATQTVPVNWNWTNNFWNGTTNITNVSHAQTVTAIPAVIQTKNNFTSPVYENTTQNFTLELNWSSGITNIDTVKFYWNATQYTTITSVNATAGNESNYTATIHIPFIPTAHQNVSALWNYTVRFLNGSSNTSNTSWNQSVIRQNNTEWILTGLTTPVNENSLQNFTLEVNWTNAIKNISTVKFYWNNTEYAVNRSVNATNQSNYTIEFLLPYITGATQAVPVSWNWTNNFYNGSNNLSNYSNTQTVNALVSAITQKLSFNTTVAEGSQQTYLFEINWSNGIKNASGVKMYWNNTEYTINSSVNNTAKNESNYTTTFNTPFIPGATLNINVEFNYTLNFMNGTSNISNISKTQTVTGLNGTINTTDNRTSYICEASLPQFNIHYYLGSGVRNITQTNFYWNETLYNGTKINDTDYYVLADVGLGNYTTTFHWNYTALFYNGSTQQFNTSENTTSVQWINISNFTTGLTGVPTRNYSLENENTHAKVNGTITGTLYYQLLGGNLSYIKKYSFSSNGTNNLTFYKFNDSQTYLVNGTLYYTAPTFSTRTYILDNASFTNTTNVTTLFMTNYTTSIVLFTVEDYTGNPQPGTIIQILQFDPATGIYNPVESLLTNFAGQSASSSMILYNTTYEFIISQGGIVYLATGPTLILSNTMIFRIDKSTTFSGSYPYNSYTDNLTVNSSYFVTWNYNDATGIFQQACLRVFQDTASGRTWYCYNCSLAASAQLTCNSHPVGNGTYWAQGWINTTTARSISMRNSWNTILNNNYLLFGLSGVLVTVILIGTLGGIGVTIGGGWALILPLVGLWFANLIGIIQIGYIPLILMTILAAALAWKIRI